MFFLFDFWFFVFYLINNFDLPLLIRFYKIFKKFAIFKFIMLLIYFLSILLSENSLSFIFLALPFILTLLKFSDLLSYFFLICNYFSLLSTLHAVINFTFFLLLLYLYVISFFKNILSSISINLTFFLQFHFFLFYISLEF